MPYGRLARVKGLPGGIGIGQGTILKRSVLGGTVCQVRVQDLPPYAVRPVYIVRLEPSFCLHCLPILPTRTANKL